MLSLGSGPVFQHFLKSIARVLSKIAIDSADAGRVEFEGIGDFGQGVAVENMRALNHFGALTFVVDPGKQIFQ